MWNNNKDHCDNMEIKGEYGIRSVNLYLIHEYIKIEKLTCNVEKLLEARIHYCTYLDSC